MLLVIKWHVKLLSSMALNGPMTTAGGFKLPNIDSKPALLTLEHSCTLFLSAQTLLTASHHQHPTGKPLRPGRSSLGFDLARPSTDAEP